MVVVVAIRGFWFRRGGLVRFLGHFSSSWSVIEVESTSSNDTEKEQDE